MLLPWNYDRLNIITIKLVKNSAEASKKKMYLIPDVKKGNNQMQMYSFGLHAEVEAGNTKDAK